MSLQVVSKDDVPKINFEKLTKNNNKLEGEEEINFLDEYMSTSAQYRISSFKINQQGTMPTLDDLCGLLIETINHNNIHTLCYGYEDMTASDEGIDTPTIQDYAKSLMTYCQVLDLKTYRESNKIPKILRDTWQEYPNIQGLYEKIKAIAKF